ncbi:hypothetical protein ACJIZ3_016479 [Penstemon smallii]|uniref:Uncharacterized protein n=1 Tax=Penstemon smallii TaxID=265156 RepID=A0ABD3RT40_9LAMI
MASIASLITTVRSEATSTGNGAPVSDYGKPPATTLLSVTKPRWIVRTEASHNTAGRTNHVKLPMLPKGEWPKWCRSCGGSGLGYCSRCVGTGEYRYIMGFQFMKNDTDHVQANQRYQVGNRKGSHSFTDLLLNNDEQSNSDSER